MIKGLLTPRNENDTFRKKPRRDDLFVEIDAVIPIKLHRSGL